MTRCDDFYKKFGREGNFCGKYPSTVKKITKFMNLRDEIANEASKSEIFIGEGAPNVHEILSEGSSRPLASIRTTADRTAAIKAIVTKFEEKFMDDAEPLALTYKEVQQIVRQIVPSAVKTAAPKDKFDKAKATLESAFKDEISESDIAATISKVDGLVSMLQTNKLALTQRQVTVNARDNANNTLGQQQPEGVEAA